MDYKDREIIRELIDQQDNIEKKVDEIRVALLGNEFNKKGGLIHRVELLEAYQRQDFILKIKVAGMWTGFCTAGGVVIWLLNRFLG